MYWFCSRIPLRCLFVLSLATGCAGCRVMDQRNRGDTVAQYEQMREQQRWWDQNRHRAEYVQGRGWYLADTGQYYDGTGRPIGDAADQVEQVAIEHEEEEVTAIAFKPLEDRLKSFVPRQIISQLKQATGNGPDQQEAREALEEANKAYREANSLSDSNDGKKREKYLTAAGRYASAARAWPDSAIEEEALFKVGECYFFADDLPEAENQFEKLVKKYPNTRFLDLIGSRRFKIAEYWLAKNEDEQRGLIQPNLLDKTQPWFDSFGHAVRLYDRIRIDDPAGGLADDATMAAANAYFAKGKYQKADLLYTDLRDMFPDSEHQFEAHLLAIKCKLLTYQGPEYDSSPLDDAEQLYKLLRRQFPQQYQKHHAMLDSSYAEIRARQAEQAWYFAQYFDRRGETSGAKHYYGQVVRDFPGTSIGDDSQQRLAELGAESEPSPSRLASIKGLFERNDDDLPPLRSDTTGTMLR